MTISFETLILNITPPFAHVTLNRPEVKNAMNRQMVLDITAAFAHLRDNREVRGIILSGAGGTFCAGGDIKELAAALQSGQPVENPTAFETMLRAVNEAPQVVVAKVEGAAMGGGLGLVCVSDIGVASADAKFGFPEVRLGLVPAMISPYVIQRIGLTRARELMLTGRRFSGEHAKAYGLVHEVWLPDDLNDHLDVLLDELRQCSPHALAACKRLLFTVMSQALDATLEYRANLLSELRRSADGMEGMVAFMQKRPPQWAQTD